MFLQIQYTLRCFQDRM